MTTRVETVVLGLLAERPMHGYDVLERFRQRGLGFWTELGRASVYQVLKPLETDAGTALGFVHLMPAANARAAVEARERSLRDLLDAVRTEIDRTAGQG